VIEAYKLIDKKGYLLTISPVFGASGCPKESKTLLWLEKRVIMVVLVGLLLVVVMVVLYAPRGERQHILDVDANVNRAAVGEAEKVPREAVIVTIDASHAHVALIGRQWH